MQQSALQPPAHLAIIMDGNGRWAEQRDQPRAAGHRAGARIMRDVVSHCAQRGVQQLTLYAFSSDNWKRPAPEVHALLALFTTHFRTHATELARSGIRLTVIGRRDRLPLLLRAAIREAERRTEAGRTMHLRVAIDYSSRAAIAHTQGDGDTAAEHTPLLPAVDLLLRTGGERRLSDFLLWECAYAELHFIDTLWPDMTVTHLDDAFADFARRDRRFGCLPDRASA
ncbi:MAG: di-trans,poly-cis-decaprenylcistransferase [Gemmatimonadaceae bacterium]|nr:di-trans,poly-cis-decaprenylcistransferase [Gemmatimonadaceae bacterium]